MKQTEKGSDEQGYDELKREDEKEGNEEEPRKEGPTPVLLVALCLNLSLVLGLAGV